MKQFIITLIIACVQTFCYAATENNPDSTKVEHQIFGNDTLVVEKVGYMFVSGIKQYIEDMPTNYKNADYDVIQYGGYEYMKKNAAAITKDILEGYGRARCKEMFELSSNAEKNLNLLVRIRVNLKGVIACVKFMYPDSYAPFMRYEDIKRNTEIILSRPPLQYPYLNEYGIELSPWITCSINSRVLQRFLEKCVDFEYNEETIHFDVNMDTTVIAYIKEQYNDSTKPDGKFYSTEFDAIINKYLQDKDVMAAIDSVQNNVLVQLKRVEFTKGNNITVRLDINETGEIIRCNFVFPLDYSDKIRPEDIYRITKKIKESVKFTPPGEYARDGISIDIQVNKLN